MNGERRIHYPVTASKDIVGVRAHQSLMGIISQTIVTQSHRGLHGLWLERTLHLIHQQPKGRG